MQRPLNPYKAKNKLAAWYYYYLCPSDTTCLHGHEIILHLCEWALIARKATPTTAQGFFNRIMPPQKAISVSLSGDLINLQNYFQQKRRESSFENKHIEGGARSVHGKNDNAPRVFSCAEDAKWRCAAHLFCDHPQCLALPEWCDPGNGRWCICVLSSAARCYLRS